MVRRKKAGRKARVDFSSCPGITICGALGITAMTLNNWVHDGCPRKKDKKYSLPEVFKWRLQKEIEKAEKPGSLKDEKMRSEIDLLKARIAKVNETYIERSMHETICTSRAGSLRMFLEKTFMANAVHFAGKTADEVRTLFYRLIQDATEAYWGKVEE